MRFVADEFRVPELGLIGYAEGACARSGSSGAVLEAVSWEDSFFSDEDCPAGEIVELGDAERARIEDAIRDALAESWAGDLSACIRLG